MIVLTEAAVSAVKTAISRAGQTDAGLRIMVQEGGCAGYKYVIGLDVEPRPDDTVVEAEGIRVFIDPELPATHCRHAGKLRGELGGFRLHLREP